MADLPQHVEIFEEGPRKGFQIEPGSIATTDKIRLGGRGRGHRRDPGEARRALHRPLVQRPRVAARAGRA